MHAEKLLPEDSDTQRQEQSAMSDEAPFDAPQPLHCIMRVLQPATPPEPKNARVIRRFDLEAAATDPSPAADAPADRDAKPARQDCNNRKQARAERNKSLLAAAGLV